MTKYTNKILVQKTRKFISLFIVLNLNLGKKKLGLIFYEYISLNVNSLPKIQLERNLVFMH